MVLIVLEGFNSSKFLLLMGVKGVQQCQGWGRQHCSHHFLQIIQMKTTINYLALPFTSWEERDIRGGVEG